MPNIEHKEFSTKEREALEKKDQAMPGGRFPIRNRQDLENAIQAYGRANDKPAVKAWIIKRAKALGLTDLLPEKWVKMEAKQDVFIGDFLEHYGVKGMKWGVRRADKKWQKNIYSIRGAIAVHNAVADRMNNGGIARLNSRHPNAHLDHPERPATRRYIQAYEQMTHAFTSEAVSSVHGISPSGTLRARYDRASESIVVEPVDAQHADDVLPTMIYKIEVGRDGRISSFLNIKDDLEQSDGLSNVLEHYGVKGMKWGQRRSRKQLERAAKSHGRSVKDMTDAELRTAVNRMNMEQQYTRLSSGGGSNRNRNLTAAGAAFLGSIALNVARTQIQNQANARIGSAIASRAAARAARRAAGG